MALQKSITLPNGATGDYIRLCAFAWDRMTKHASAHLMLYTSATHAAQPSAEALCLIGKLRLDGAKFDQYLSNAVLDAGQTTVIGQLYAAAKAEPVISGGGLPCPALGLPAPALADAADV